MNGSVAGEGEHADEGACVGKGVRTIGVGEVEPEHMGTIGAGEVDGAGDAEEPQSMWLGDGGSCEQGEWEGDGVSYEQGEREGDRGSYEQG